MGLTTGDTELATAATRGSHAAFVELVQRYRPAVRAVLGRFTESTWQLEDLQQEAWLQAWLSIRSLRQPGRVSAWLQGIALNVGRRWASVEQRRSPTVVRGIDGDQIPVTAVGSRVERSVASIVGFEALNPRHRKLLRLKYDERLSYAEIAERMASTASAVQSALHRARSGLGLARAGVRAKEEGMTEVQIGAVELLTYTETDGGSRAVAAVDFQTSDGEAVVRMVWGRYEAEAAVLTLESRTSPRPLTHDLAHSLLTALGGRLQAVEISSLVHTTFYATLRIESGGDVIELDSRPSDAVNLALRAGAPILVSPAILKLREAVSEPSEGGAQECLALTARKRIWPIEANEGSDN